MIYRLTVEGITKKKKDVEIRLLIGVLLSERNDRGFMALFII